MGFLDGLLNVASAAIDLATEYTNVRRDQLFEEQVRQENAQIEEYMETIKDTISNLRDLMSTCNEQIEDITNAISSKDKDTILDKLSIMDCIASVLGDEAWFRENYFNDGPSRDTLIECMENWKEITKSTDETFNETDEEEGCTRQHLRLDSSRLAHRMHMLLEDIEEKDIYQVAQTAIKYINDFVKSLKNAIYHWNLLLEDGYSYLCDDDDDEYDE